MKKLIELTAVTLLAVILSKGLFFGIFAGIIIWIAKLAYNNFMPESKKIEAPFHSVGIGALAGLLASLVNMLL